MAYTNEKIKRLIAERNAAIDKYDREIRAEIEKEKSNYKFSWKHFLLTVGAIVFFFVAIQANKRIFPKTSIWSWAYYEEWINGKNNLK